MRILMLGIKEYPYGASYKHEKYPGGGTAREVIALSEALASNGHLVNLVVRKMPGQQKTEFIDRLHIYRVSWINNRYLRLPTFSLFSFLFAFKIVKNVDLIHTHGSFVGIFGIILSRLHKKRVVGTPHGLTSFQAKEKYHPLSVSLTRAMEKWSYSNVDKLVFVSHDEKDFILKKLEIKPKAFDIVNIGIKPLMVERKRSKLFKIVFIGRLVPSKGIERLIDSFSLLPKRMQNVTRYFILGDGYYRSYLENLVKRKKLEGKVLFPGFIGNIEKYLSDASIFLLPSSGGEGLPSSLLEAMSAGVPCVVSNFKAPMAKDTILLLKDNKAETIARSLTLLFYDKIKLFELGEKGKNEFHNKFSIEKVVINYEKTYLSLINNNILRAI